jgi:two-component system, response regulator
MSAGPTRVLVVEDDSNDVLFLRRALTKRGVAWKVDVASDGEQALKAISADPPPSHIILDLKIPRKNGLEVLGHIRSEPRTRDLRVVVLTSSAEKSDLERATKLGVDLYLIKPVDFSTFLVTIDQIVQTWTPDVSTSLKL